MKVAIYKYYLNVIKRMFQILIMIYFGQSRKNYGWELVIRNRTEMGITEPVFFRLLCYMYDAFVGQIILIRLWSR